MGRFLACVLAVLAASGCASWPDKPQICFSSEPQIAPADAAQAKAIAYVKHREARRCSAAGVECSLRLQVQPTGEIFVVASTASLAGRPPSCRWLEGAFTTYIFSPSGEYSRVALGL